MGQIPPQTQFKISEKDVKTSLKLMVDQQKRRRNMRFCFILFGVLTALLGLATFYIATQQPHAERLRVGVSPQGELTLALHHTDLLRAQSHYQLGVQSSNKKTLRWSEKFKGKIRDIEFYPNGDVIALSDTYALHFPRSKSDQEQKLGAPEYLNYYAQAQGTEAAITGEAMLPTAATEGKLILAGLDQGKLRAYPAQRADEAVHEVKLEALEGAPSGVALLPAGKRLQFLAQLHAQGNDGKALSPQGQLYAVSFELARQPLSSLSSASEDSSEEGSAVEESSRKEGVSPEETEPEGLEEQAESSLQEQDEAEEESQEPILEPSGQEAGPEEDRFVYLPVNIQVKRLAVHIESFFALTDTQRLLVLYREYGELAWKAVLGKDQEWSDPFEVKGPKPETPLLRAQQAAPLLAFSQNKLYQCLLHKDKKHLEVYAADISEQGLGSWSHKASFELPFFYDQNFLHITLGLFLATLVGNIFCGIWLGLRRGHPMVSVVDRSAKDQEKEIGLFMQKLAQATLLWASMGRRLIALFIDLLVCGIPVMILTDMTGLDFEKAMNLYPFFQEQGLLDGIVERTLTLLVLALYGFFCEASFGATLGKRVLGLKVVNVKGEQAGSIALFMRNILRILEWCHPLLIFISMMSVIFSPKRQRLGDLLAGTGVIIALSAKKTTDRDSQNKPQN